VRDLSNTKNNNNTMKEEATTTNSTEKINGLVTDKMNGKNNNTADEFIPENNSRQREVDLNRLSSVADVEDRRRSSISRRSSASWPENTPDPICPTLRLSETESPLNLQDQQYQLQQLQEQIQQQQKQPQHHNLYDSPHNMSYIPSSRSGSGSKQRQNNKPQIHGEPTKEEALLTSPNSSLDSPPLTSPLQHQIGRRRSSFTLADLNATILFVDLEGYSRTTNLTQRHITRAFMTTLSNLLTFCYGKLPSRMNVEDYVILPTGDGAAVVVFRPPLRRVLGCNVNGGDDLESVSAVVAQDSNSSSSLPRLSQSSISSSSRRNFGLHCLSCSQISLQTTEETALWLGSSLLLWSDSIQIGLRVGLYSGELSIVEDPYGDPNVCGDAINMAARIMDTALPGQILASAGTVVKRLQQSHDNSNSKSCECVCSKCPHMRYEIASQPSEVVVKHGVTTNVHSITVELYQLPQEPEPSSTEDDRLVQKVASDEKEDVLDSASDRRTRSMSLGNEQIPVHPLAEIKRNPKKQSFASLSSMQHTGSSTGLTSMSSSPTKQQQPRSDALTLKRPTPQTVATNTTICKSNTETAPTSTQTTTAQQPHRVGNHKTPVTKWYMKIKPTEMKASDGRIKPKVLPQELIRRHHKIAFIGIMHDNLSKAFIKILQDEPHHRWDEVFVLFPSDECLKNTLAQSYSQPVEKLIENKKACRSSLFELLSPVVDNLKFLQYDQLMHCGSYWDWSDPGGFIHVSPVTWGANPKTCPAMNYYWNSKVPSPEYKVYREGLEYLLKVATPF
jgi:hypothetical protein